MQHTIFVLGATRFIGREVVAQARTTGWHVKALARTREAAEKLRAEGVEPVEGDATQPEQWIERTQDAVALIDLLQPKLPPRLTVAQGRRLSVERQELTRGIIGALQSLPNERPLLFSVSGADDLQPDARGVISGRSPLRSSARGFGRIGLPVRRLIEGSKVEATYVYFGNIVYGPGKVFAEMYVRGLAEGKARIVGNGANHLPLIHVADAASAIVHLAGLPRSELIGTSWVVMDGADTTQRQLLDDTADLMGVKHASAVPTWLARLVAGQMGVETITLDVRADPAALLATGFAFRYPSYREGVPATLAQLGVAMSASAVHRRQ